MQVDLINYIIFEFSPIYGNLVTSHPTPWLTHILNIVNKMASNCVNITDTEYSQQAYIWDDNVPPVNKYVTTGQHI